MAPLSLLVTPPTLIHISLAYISPESRYFDRIIHLHSQRTLRVSVPSRTNIHSLPAELLLLIRASLQLQLADTFQARTARALQAYERSMRDLLCAHCRAYNEEVFGGSVWQWEGFSGGCSCDQIGKERDRRQKPPQSSIPNEFMDPQHWIEAYLSGRYRHFSARPDTSAVGVWDLVQEVLQTLGCEIVEPNSSLQSSSIHQSQTTLLALLSHWGHFPTWICRPKFLMVAPLPSNKSFSGSEAIRTGLVLSHLRRELGLDNHLRGDVEREDRANPLIAVTSSLEPTSFSPERRGDRKKLNSYFLFPCFMCPSALFLLFVQSMTECISMPLAFLVTVVCFYSRPGTLRLL
jgi:hypothetical protein